MTSAVALTPVTSLKDWFRVNVHAALDRQRLAAEPHTEHYVVDLLTAFARSENLYEHHRDGFGLRPLALMLADALEAPHPEHRHLLLRRLGDVSLFVAGFFAGSLARKPVDVDYYAKMGGTAYAALADVPATNVREQALSGVFAELAGKFLGFVDVLAEIAEGAGPPNDTELMRLYELWVRTGSPRAARRLRALGLEPAFANVSRAQH
jgi:hypothetical protein